MAIYSFRYPGLGQTGPHHYNTGNKTNGPPRPDSGPGPTTPVEWLTSQGEMATSRHHKGGLPQVRVRGPQISGSMRDTRRPTSQQNKDHLRQQDHPRHHKQDGAGDLYHKRLTAALASLPGGIYARVVEDILVHTPTGGAAHQAVVRRVLQAC